MKVKSYTIYFDVFGVKKRFTIESNTINSEKEAEEYVKNILIPKNTKIWTTKYNGEKKVNVENFISEKFDDIMDKFGKLFDGVFGKSDKNYYDKPKKL